MIINNNIPALNTYRQMGINNNASGKAMEKLSSGLRINKAGDDAAGLAISEKMRAQVRGLDQASRNSQDGISMIQTAEGSLQETHNILQRMRELATQASNDTNVEVDRNEIQKEMNSLSSEINRIGNTTEFNTQNILKGDGGVKLDGIGIAAASTGKLTGGLERVTTEATATSTITAPADATSTWSIQLGGQTLTASFRADTTASEDSHQGYNIATSGTTTTADVNIDAAQTINETAGALRETLQKMIDENDELKGNFVVSGANDAVTITAVKGGAYEGSAGTISAVTTGGTATSAAGTANTGTTTPPVAASKTLTMPAFTSVNDLVGKGVTINDTVLEFYDASKGAYQGDAQGIDVSGSANIGDVVDKIVAQAKVDGVVLSNDTSNLKVTAAKGGLAGNNITAVDGGIQNDFKATFQVGANQGQSMTIEIGDMRAKSLGVTADAGTQGFQNGNGVTNGTDNTTREAALDVSSHDNATAAIKTINNAIEKVSAERSNLGANQNRLEHTIANLANASENLQAAESRVRDVDMAKEVMEMTRANILGQASQAMLAQANQKPQSVLQLLG